MELLAQIADKLLNGDDESVSDLTSKALAQGLQPKQILDEGLLAGMAVVGEKFKCHDIYLPDVLMAAQAMNAGMEHLKPLLSDGGVRTLGKVVLGSVQGDLHDIGKNLVGVLLKGAGLDVIDLGNDVPPERFVEAATEQNAAVIGMSALLTTTMPAMSQVVGLVKQRGLSGKVRTIIGGAPVSEKYAREIGADAYAFDAASAAERVKGLIASAGSK